MRVSIVLLALAGSAIAHDGAHTTGTPGAAITLTASTTITVYSCAGAAANSCSQGTLIAATHTPTSLASTPVIVTAPTNSATKIETPGTPADTSAVKTETITTPIEIPTTLASTPVATITPIFNLTVSIPTINNTVTKSTSLVTSMTIVTPSPLEPTPTQSATPTQGSAGIRAAVPGLMLGVLAVGVSLFA